MSLPDLARLVRFDERLREVPTDSVAVEAALGEATRALDTAREPEDRLRLLTYAGKAARVLGRTDESIEYLQAAFDTADGERAVGAQIRLGEAYRCADRHDEAVRILEEALLAARGSGAYLDFALQHLGKALVDAGRPALAVAPLEEALELRRKGGDAELIESTERALARAVGR